MYMYLLRVYDTMYIVTVKVYTYMYIHVHVYMYMSHVQCSIVPVQCRRRTSSRKSRLKLRPRKSTKQSKPASADISTQETTTPGHCVCIFMYACLYTHTCMYCTSTYTCIYIYNLRCMYYNGIHVTLVFIKERVYQFLQSLGVHVHDNVHVHVYMKALKCKTLGASVMYINIHVYTWQYAYIRGQMRECTGKYKEIWQRQK